MVLHGYSQLAAEAAEGVGVLDDGTRLVVAPEGLSRFYDAPSLGSHRDARVGASWMTREDRLEEIADQAEWLQRAYEHAVGFVARFTPFIILGFSQGATAAARWVASGRVKPAQLIIWGAALPPELDLGLASPLRAVRTSVVLGSRDRWVKPEQVAAERARLDAAGFPYRFVSFEGGHRFDDDTLRRLSSTAG